MRTRPDDAALDAALRSLDPAPRAELTDHEQERAEATFARLVSSPVPTPDAAVPRRRIRRRAAAVAAAATAAVAGVAAPALLGGGGAFASWTPTPEPVSSAEVPAVVATCRDAMGAPDRGEDVVLAEQRGDWVFVLLASPGERVTCLMEKDFVGRSRETSEGFVGGGWDPDDPPAPVLAPDGLAEGTSMESVTEDDATVSFVEGYLGSNVTAVEVHVSTGLDVEASVGDGRFAAWWPGRPQSSTVPSETFSYTVTLADGTTREVDRDSLTGD